MEYPPCKKCGASHGMGIEETATGNITPIDLCYDCLWEGFPYELKNLYTKIELEDDIEKMKEKLKNLEMELIKNG